MTAKIKITAAAAAALMAISLAGCTESSNVSSNDTSADKPAATETTVSSVSSEAFEISAADKDIGYSEGDAVRITMSGSEAEIEGSGAEVSEGKLSITEAGTYILSGEFSGQIYVKAKGAEIKLVLDGVAVTNSDHAALLIDKADKVTITLNDGTENSFTDGSSYTAESDDDNTDGAIFSRADLTINGEGSLTVNGNCKHGIVSKDDLVITGGSINVTAASTALSGKDSVKISGGSIDLTAGSNGIHATNSEETEKGIVSISGGTIAITSQGDAIQAENAMKIEDGELSITTGGGSENAEMKTEAMPFGNRGEQTADTSSAEADTVSAKALKAASIQIAGGNISIDSSDDAVHANGSAEISGGSITIRSGDDGIHADGVLTISGGSIDIQKSYEGIEGNSITVTDGTVNVIAADDGFNSAGGSDTGDTERSGRDSFMQGDPNCNLTFAGGTITVSSEGDGLDSNGNLYVTGGIIYVNGPTNGGNAALDCGDQGCTIEITGGTIIAAGSVGMEVGFGETSTQYSVLHNFGSAAAAGSEFTVTDSDGNVILSFTPEKSYQSVVFSSAELKEGKYTAKAGDQSEEIEISSIVTSNSTGMGFGGGGFRGGNGGGFTPPDGGFTPPARQGEENTANV
ncbi:MAG: carbohydrate-binding domain-containing protein [Ruminococcus sp.]|nr:carbohydrate-binding domain-containing protein [Ruminococcus sp.]